MIGKKMQVHEPRNFGNAAFAQRCAQADRPPHGAARSVKFASRDQITGFHADRISRYFAPSFSTWPIEGKVKWKPTTVAFSAAAMS